MELAEYHALKKLPTPQGPLYLKRGVVGMDDPNYSLLAGTIDAGPGAALDLNPGSGLVSLAMLAAGTRVSAYEERRAALRALEATAREHQGLQVKAALPWQAHRGAFKTVALVLGAERGNDWVRAQLEAAACALEPGGSLWLAGGKKQGFERYLNWTQKLVGPAEVVARAGGARVAVLEKDRPCAAPKIEPQVFSAQLRGRELSFYALPGVFSAGEVDPASRLLLENLESASGLRVLDLGAGYGALSLPLALEGASVTLLEQSLAAVQSARMGFDAAGAAGEVLHSDVDEALPEGSFFDIVISNPPFHVGGHVVLDVAEAFVAAAHSRLRPGGRFYLVANPFLKYEVWMRERFGNVRELYAGQYKVLLSVKA